MKNINHYLLGASILLALLAMRPQLQNDSGKSDMEEKKTHRIVFHVTTPDTAAYRAMSRQIVHVLEHWPTAQIEVVAHNKGIGLLEKKKSNVADKISALTTQGVRFVAYEQTMKIQKLEKSDILPEAGFVERGVVHVVERQEEGWVYIKAGF